MSIELDKNKSEILKVFNDVLDDKTATDWALFGYEGQTNVLKVVGSGNDGIEELSEDLNASKIMYGVLRVTDPKTTRTKIILLNWQGEGAPNLRKGICSRHLQDVKRMLKGVHITITARTEEDVDSEMVLDAVAKATSTEYNFKERAEIPDKNVPVGTNYKRTNPQSEIDANRRNKFWEEQETEEKRRKEEEIKRKEEEAKKMEKDRLEREVRDSKHREEINKERNQRILITKKAEMVSHGLAQHDEAQAWKEEQSRQEQEEVSRARRADVMRMERKKEAESLIGHKTHETRSIFETSNATARSSISHSYHSDAAQPEWQTGSKPPSRKLKRDFNPSNDEISPSYQKENVAPKRSVGARWPPPAEEAENTTVHHNAAPGRISDWKPQVMEVPNSYSVDMHQSQQSAMEIRQSFESPRVSTGSTTPTTHPSTASTTNIFQNSNTSYTSPVNHSTFATSQQHTSPQTQQHTSPQKMSTNISPLSTSTATIQSHNSAISSTTFSNSSHTSPLSTTSITHISENGGDHYHPTNGRADPYGGESDVTSPYGGEEEDELGSVSMTYEVDGVEYQILPEHGLCARALYDYQAADDTEITFDPGDIITNIDQIDVGWWQGVSAIGVFGLFPANYVELINGRKVH